ncbi:hypothetical protein SAMN05443665_104418 [Actinomadura meyerae]|uniref:Uncharacterized protein n=1 Tax=Actinomadura meyerae TaxID=240840 RepID=A0A239NML2_9ACTN|nr:hypothetical protein [Actinomadura meyerae]SNT55693.1 hypothetical protein SAMN05443665_104418 [Actinomadura meyerae]
MSDEVPATTSSDASNSQPAAIRGPHAWLNWQAWRVGQPRRVNSRTHTSEVRPLWEEFGLYSDVRISGALRLGPYEILQGFPPEHGVPGARLMLVLRAHDHLLDAMPEARGYEEQEITVYAGGDLGEQIASLLALALARRVRSGGVTRIAFEDDPHGQPMAIHHYAPTLEARRLRQMLPAACDDTRLADAECYLNTFAGVASPDAVAIMRAARQYADALWWADLDPRISWIKLFGALEAAADRWDVGVRPDSIVQLERRHKGMYNRLSKKVPDALPLVAKSISGTLGAEGKLIDFALTYAPPPPATRPEFGLMDWDNLEVALRVLYDHRSRDLHGGIPFPEPLCSPPLTDSNDYAAEAFPGMGATSGGGSWPADRLPMYLHTFAYITGEVLRSWWLGLPTDTKPEQVHTR